MLDEFKNADGTYNGVAFLAALSGLSEVEIKWTADRLKQLMHVEKKSKEEATGIVKEEAKTKPWEKK